MPQTAPAAPLALETEGLNYLLEDRERLIAELHTAYATQRQLSEELSSLKSLQHQNKLIPIEYGYQPSCRNQHWAKTPSLQKLTQHMRENEPTYTAQLARFARHIPHFTAIALNESDCLDATRPFWLNDWIPALDAITLYGYLVEKNPRFYVEVGSGNSTKFVRQAIKDHHLRTRIISIDPAPRAEIDFVCDDIIRKPLENVDLTFFKMLTAEDMVFIDNSHIAFMNTDVTVFFCEILCIFKHFFTVT